MSASTSTAPRTLGTGQRGVVLVAIALAIVLAGVIAFGQLLATKVQTQAAPGLAPAAVIDHGSRTQIDARSAVRAPVSLDRDSWYEGSNGTAANSNAAGRSPRSHAQ